MPLGHGCSRSHTCVQRPVVAGAGSSKHEWPRTHCEFVVHTVPARPVPTALHTVIGEPSDASPR